jgi:hypothetical protein
MKKTILSVVLAAGCVSAGQPRSVLKFSVPHELEKPQIEWWVDTFREHDYSLDGFFSMGHAFTGGDEELLEKFNKTMREPYYFQVLTPFTASIAETPTDFTVHTYYKPYEYEQSKFLKWTKDNLGRDDFLPANARKTNAYRGDLISPFVYSKAERKALDLKKTFGKCVTTEDGKLTFIQDNRVNPMRWIAPDNEVLHHETSSSFFLSRVSKEQDKELAKIFKDYWTGADRSKRVLLNYKIRVKLTNYAEEMGEKSIYDMYEPGELEKAEDLITATHSKIKERVATKDSGAAYAENYMKTRLESPFLQVSVVVNFKETAEHYFLQEFMVVDKNYQSTTKGFTTGDYPIRNARLREEIYEGGSAETEARCISWNRLKVDTLKDLKDGVSDIPGHPIIVEGGNHVDWDHRNDKVLEATVSGTIDLTNYYLHARERGFFPGASFQNGSGDYVGFSEKKSHHYDPDLPIGMAWAGFMFEMTGPFKLVMEGQELDVVIAENL